MGGHHHLNAALGDAPELHPRHAAPIVEELGGRLLNEANIQKLMERPAAAKPGFLFGLARDADFATGARLGALAAAR
jgi:hypothetical protein